MLTHLSSRAETSQSGAELLANIKIVLAYENLSSAIWAAETFAGWFGQSPAGRKTQLIPWSFSTLLNPTCYAQAADAASHADVIVIAASSPFRLLPALVETWLRKCLAGPRTVQTTVAALFGCGNRPDHSDSVRLQAVRQLAEKAGCRFFFPCATETT